MTDEMILMSSSTPFCQMESQQPIPVQGLQRPNNNERVEHYRWKQSKVLGVLQILIGFICAICNSGAIGVFNYGTAINLVDYIFLISILIVSFMWMCIIISIFSTIIVLAQALNLALPATEKLVDCEYYENHGFEYGRACPQRGLKIAMQSVKACMAVIEAVLAIWGCVICCVGVDWCATSQVTSSSQHSTQQTNPVGSQQAPVQQVSYSALPTSNGQNVQLLANTNQMPPLLPPTLYQNTEMTWDPPPYVPNVQVPTYEEATANKNGTFS